LSTTQIPFIKWGSCKSDTKDKPDVLELQIADPETFETAYSINVRVYEYVENQKVEKILPLKAHESVNSSLLKEWGKNSKKDLIKPNKIFKLFTWLDVSKNGRPIRRFKLVF
jgi:hypothetical protein